jgi:hypothetical protein
MKFSIRELLLLTVVIALVCGWYVDGRLWHSLHVRENRRLLEYADTLSQEILNLRAELERKTRDMEDVKKLETAMTEALIKQREKQLGLPPEG